MRSEEIENDTSKRKKKKKKTHEKSEKEKKKKLFKTHSLITSIYIHLVRKYKVVKIIP